MTSEEQKKEVELWLEQRRKNWPTKKRIIEKKEADNLKEVKGIDTGKDSLKD